MGKFGMIYGILILACIETTGFAQESKPLKPILSQEQNTADLAKVKDLYNRGHYEMGLEIVHNHKEDIEKLDPNGLRWFELFIKGSEEMRDSPQLAILFEFFPEIFKEHEQASLLVADSYIINHQIKDYKKMRSLWQDRETKIAAWFILDADRLLLEGKRKEAMELLKSRTFKGKADVARLTRIALLTAEEDPKTAWKHLTEAHNKSPQDPDIRSYKAKLLETSGKHNMAHNEYQEAAKLHPENVHLQDQLANFYIRQQEYDAALGVLKANLRPPSSAKIWVETLFWSRVRAPFAFDWKETPSPQGKLEPLVDYLVELKKGVFWDEDKFKLVANNTYFLKTIQETFWLKLLNALQNNDEKEAYKLLKYNPFLTSSWYPEALDILKRVLNYRLNGSLKIEAPIVSLEHANKNLKMHFKSPPLFQQLEMLAAENEKELPPEWNHFIMSREIFSAIFLAMQWTEAGLSLHQIPILPNDFPAWVSYNLTEAIHKNRGVIEALEFANAQKETPELLLLIGELTISGGDTEAASQILKKIAKDDTDSGFRAAWLLSLIQIDKKEWKDAKTTIISQPRLVNTILGKETLARIAHLEGDDTLADKLYGAIEKSSSEARSYLAKRAYANKDWERAKILTEQLISDHPDNATLKINLNKIIEEQNNIKNKDG